MSVMEKAQELADEILDTDEYETLQAVQEKVNGDEDAQQILQQIQNKQRQAQMAQQNGQPVSDDIRQDLQSLQAKMQENDTLKELQEAEENFNKVMETVNQVISGALQGE